MATTEAAIVTRVRSVIVDLGFCEAVSLDGSRQPVTAVDGSFFVRYVGGLPRGGMNWSEEARGLVTVSVMRLIREDYPAAQNQLLTDARAIINAIARDGEETSGEYVVEDSGRGVDIETPRGANHVIGRVRVPVNFEAQL